MVTLYERFVPRSRAAAAAYSSWSRNPRRRDVVVPRVMAHTTGVVDSFTPTDVKLLLERIAGDRSLHAIGDIQRHDIETAPAIADWNPTFALVHLIHFVIEDLQKLPTFWELRDHPLCSDLHLWREANDAIAESIAVDGVSDEIAKQAVQWRIGLAYYSVIREQWVAAVLR